ncbi:MAG: hypothetical protein COA47_00425 [Robiginitomaculum sp.]|nr:MAG: hypothetical protein COA47_00425 [Robiginitomaculum sp.]
MRVVLQTPARLVWPGHSCRAVIGSGGLIAAAGKREGDGTTPIGTYTLRRVLFRADRLKAPQTDLPCRALEPHDGWCDEPKDAAYNRPVVRPYPASNEQLTREDLLYDLLVVLGHNDQPPVPGLGSAVFLHVARANWAPTRGCVAISELDLRALLRGATPGSQLEILPEPAG